MKKNVIFCLCMAVVCLFASCNKDQEGVYTPSKKIQKVYKMDDGLKELREIWNWDGKLLKSVDYFDEVKLSTDNLYYDDHNRLTSIQSTGGTTSTFTYDGNRLQRIVVTSDGSEVATYTFTHDDNIMTEISAHFSSFDIYDLKSLAANPLEMVMPEMVAPMKEVLKKADKDAKAGADIVAKLTWTGDNVTYIDAAASVTVLSTSLNVNIRSSLTYDEMNNPYHGAYCFLSDVNNGGNLLSKNNVKEMTTTVSSALLSSSSVTTNVYEYEDKYPVKKIETEVEGDDIDVEVYFYEY